MKGRIYSIISSDKLLRVTADVILINTAIFLAVIFRFLFVIAFENSVITNTEIFNLFINAYLKSFWILTLINIIVFSLSGIYTHRRFYQGRYKALAIVQAVSISYLIFGFSSFLFPELNNLPRSVLVLSWGLTILFLTVARLWLNLWRYLEFSRNHKRSQERKQDGRRIENILVIGGAGYVGSALIPKLLDSGYKVRILDLLLFGKEPIADVIDHPNLEIIQADFRHVDKVVSATKGVDSVIHLGAIVGDPACSIDEDLTIETNLMATRMIAEVAKGYGIEKFIFASTCSVYGAGDYILNEQSTLNPVSLYARSKIASEKVLQKLAGDNFFPIILRFGTIYGLSGRTRFDLVINLLTATAFFENEIKIYGGEQWRPFVHVDDVALAILKVVEAPLYLVKNQIFNVGSNEQNYTIKQIGELVKKHVPAAELINGSTDSDRRNYRVDFTKIHKYLNFKPQWTVEQGIQQVLDAIKSGKISDYRDYLYNNYKFFHEYGVKRKITPENGWVQQLLKETTEESYKYELIENDS